jgi:hypothetical protein
MLIASVCGCLAIIYSGCTEPGGPLFNDGRLTDPAWARKVVITPETSILDSGSAIQLAATVINDKGDTLDAGTVRWESSDTSIVVVSTTGLARGVRLGSAKVTASSAEARSSGTITVQRARSTLPASIDVTPSTVDIPLGKTAQLKATVKSGAGATIANAPVTWSTSNAAVASVSSTGVVQGNGTGMASITATSGSLTASATVTVLAAPIAKIAVSPGSGTVEVGKSIQLTAAPQDDRGNALPGRIVAWASSDPAIVRVSSTGLVTGQRAGRATVSATSGGVTGTSTITVPASTEPPPSPPPGGTPSLDLSRQPSGMTLLADRAFSSRATSSSDTKGAEGWSPDLEARSNYITIMRDATAPHDGTVWRLTYPAGKPDNPANSFSPVHAWMPLKSRPKVVYLSLWLKLSSDWLQHPGGETKLALLVIANQSRMVLSLTGTGTGPITPVVRINGGPDPRAGGYLKQNVSSRTFSRGSWHRFEAVLTANTPGVANGGARWWLDGVELGNYSNVQWAGSGESASWSQLDFNPIWGGRNAQLSQTQYMWVEHLYASGK